MINQSDNTVFIQAHEFMSPSELALIFQVEHHDDGEITLDTFFIILVFILVPEYEIINIHHRRHKRSTDSDQVHQVGYPNPLYLSYKIQYFRLLWMLLDSDLSLNLTET